MDNSLSNNALAVSFNPIATTQQQCDRIQSFDGLDTTDFKVVASPERAFRASFAIRSLYGCSYRGVILDSRGYVEDGPGNYSNNLFCSWIIAPTNATYVQLDFSMLDTEATYDLVTIYSCTSVSCDIKDELDVLSGSLLPTG